MNPFANQQEFSDHTFTAISMDNDELQDTAFYDCIFANCSFRETTLNQCVFHDCVFTGCDLSLLDVRGTLFRNVNFIESKLIGINWTVAIWPKFLVKAPVSFHECVLDYSTFLGLSLQELTFNDCKAEEADFSEADLTQANFSHTKLARCRFNRTNLTGANFEHAVDYQIDVTLNKVKDARFTLPEAISLLDSLGIKLVE